MSDRILKLTGVRNFRDFGGYETEEGRRIQRGRLFRSGHFAEATDEDLAAIEALRVAIQADLRRPDERERHIGRWPAEGVRIILSDQGRETEAPHINFLNQVSVDGERAAGWMTKYYKVAPFRPQHVETYSAWFDALANLDDGQAALVNCAAGKDRTGILCALTHHLLGVSREDIVEDYELTNIAAEVDLRLPEAQEFFNQELGKNYDADVYRPFLGVESRYLNAAFDSIEAESGSIDAYLEDGLGVSEAKRREIRARLLEDA